MIDPLHQAASFDWETLAPVIFFVLYGLAQLFGSKKRKQAKDKKEGEVDPVEQARRIREEIRRKIEERRQDSEPGTTRPVNRPGYDPTVSETQQRPVQQFPAQKREPRPEPVAHPRRPAPMPRGEDRGARMKQQLAEQRKRLEKARLEQVKAKEQAQRMMRDAGATERMSGSHSTGEVVPTHPFQKQLLRGLRDPNGLRKAVLYREILGPPIGLR